MSAENRHALILGLILLSCVCWVPVGSCLRMPEPESTAKQFKIGSHIRDLRSQLQDWAPSEVKVVDGARSGTAIDALPADFSGIIRFYHFSWVIPDDVKPSFVIELRYENGKLTHLDYGILPG